jgi:hypothetical protein
MGVLAVFLAVALVIATQAGGRYLQERDSADRASASAVAALNNAQAQLGKATSAQLASESLPLKGSDPLTAAQDSVLAWGLNPGSPQARFALLTAAANPLTAVFTSDIGGSRSPSARMARRSRSGWRARTRPGHSCLASRRTRRSASG